MIQSQAMNYKDPEKKLIDNFHRLFYGKGQLRAHGDSDEITVAMDQWYCGFSVQKNPLDLWIFQEIIWECRPDLIIEMGTASGASALFMAHQLDLLDEGTIITVDIANRLAMVPRHPRIFYVVGDTLNVAMVDWVREKVKELDKKRVMLILDDDHGTEHVLEELLQYSKLVTPGQYLIVEDTNVDYPLQYGRGPGAAVDLFLADDRSTGFVRDRTREKFLLTYNPGGYLKRI
jgi:cephalosporin hydroxylase